MLGAREMAQLLADRSLDLLPGEIERLGGELGVATAVPLPGEPPVEDLDASPRLIASTQLPTLAVGVDSWPFVMVVPRAMTGMRLLDQDHTGRRLIRQTWAVRWWVYARGDGYHLTAAVRDRLTLAVMEMLWRFPSASGTLSGQAWQLQVVPESMTASPSDIDERLGGIIGACYVEVPVLLDSSLTPREQPIPVTQIAVSSTRMPDPVHPAFQ